MQSGCRWVYTLRDWDTEEIVAQGTSAELAAQGYFPSADKLSSVYHNWEKCRNPTRETYKWRLGRISAKEARAKKAKAEGLSPKETAETRMVKVYRCYDAAGNLVGEGTAAELKDAGLFGYEGTVHSCYQKGGVYRLGGIVRMERELLPRRVRHARKLEEQPKQPPKPKRRKAIGGVKDPSALAYDVHDLMEYNRRARELRLPELTYGYWAAKGKPATP